MDWEDVIEVKPESSLTLTVRFADGLCGKVRFEPQHLHGVFECIKNPALFAQAYVDHGAVTWPDGLDLAPDTMYNEIKAHGEWVLR